MNDYRQLSYVFYDKFNVKQNLHEKNVICLLFAHFFLLFTFFFYIRNHVVLEELKPLSVFDDLVFIKLLKVNIRLNSSLKPGNFAT